MTPQPGTALLPASATGSASLEEEAAAAAAAGGLEYAKEILITKSELEEKNQLVANLQNQVEETRTESEYQMRLKDNHYKEEQAKARKQFGQQISGMFTSQPNPGSPGDVSLCNLITSIPLRRIFAPSH